MYDLFRWFFLSPFPNLLIQVEGEINKLSMEEAGYPNCVSIPYSSPKQVSKELSVEVLARLEFSNNLFHFQIYGSLITI